MDFVRFLSFWLILSCFQLVSCKQPEQKTEPPEEILVDFDLDKIKERGVLYAIVDNSSTGYFHYRGQPMGYEYELLGRYCSSIGVKLELIKTRHIDEAFQFLNEGKGDVVAYFLAITKERKERVLFTESLITTRQTLVQKKPDGWKKMWSGEIDQKLVRDQTDLIGKTVVVRKSSAFKERLENLSDEMGDDIMVLEDTTGAETEDLIWRVLNEEIEYTVADEEIALVNAAYYPDLDVRTPVSFPQRIAWAVRKNAPQLKSSLDEWIKEIKSGQYHQIIYNKYFKVDREIVERAMSEYSSFRGNNISEFDPVLRRYADSVRWDWRLLASMVYQESRFKANARSWAGARGLMQLMPTTGSRFGARDLYDPEQNIMAGTRYLEYLNELWMKTVPDSSERLQFVLASYNIGQGHVQDAQALAEELDLEPHVWGENVGAALALKSSPEYYNHEVVKYGYCRGQAAVSYVNTVLGRFRQYKENYGY